MRISKSGANNQVKRKKKKFIFTITTSLLHNSPFAVCKLHNFILFLDPALRSLPTSKEELFLPVVIPIPQLRGEESYKANNDLRFEP